MSTHTFFSLCVPRPLATVQEANWDAQREKACLLTLTLMLVRNLAKHLRAAAKFSDLAPLLGPNLDPKTGPKQRPKRRNENVIQFWTLFWGPYLNPKMGSAIGEFRCCPQMFCKQICTEQLEHECQHIPFSTLCVPRPLATVEVPLSQPCFEHFFRPCFRGSMMKQVCWHSRRCRGSPRPDSDAKLWHEDKARLTGTRINEYHVKTE